MQFEMQFAELTQINYEKTLSEVEQFFEQQNMLVENATKQDLRKYLLTLYDKGYEKSTIAQKISVIKSFYNFLLLKNMIQVNPAATLTYPKKDKKLPTVLYIHEIQELLASIDPYKKYGKRDKALVMTLYSTGLRVSELVSMDIDSIDFDENLIKVIGKRNKERIVPFDSYTREYILDYVELERDELIDNEETSALWINNKKSRLTDRGMRSILNRLVNKTSIMTKVSPHTLRHSLATNLLKAGMDIRYVQEILGHESLNTTQIYTHLDSETLVDQINKLDLRR